MDSSWLLLFIAFVIIVSRRNNKIAARKKVIKQRQIQKGEKTKMVELAKRFIGKECLVYTFDSINVPQGIIKEVSDGAILIEKDNNVQIVNLDFVTRIQEYPRDKKGKKKAVVW
ncbi:MAG: hypothetical protein IIV45_13765 [Lachnospiraceae bacterium]|nr:hypothetical protein [Lachnospiraceae bacterium]